MFGRWGEMASGADAMTAVDSNETSRVCKAFGHMVGELQNDQPEKALC